MPAEQQLVTFDVRPVAYEDELFMDLDGDREWGQPECALYYTRALGRNAGREVEWMSISDEVAKRLYLALGTYLVKKARDAGR